MITLLRNARIFTADDEQPWAEVLAYKDDKLIYVGKDEPRTEGEEVRTIDLEGRFVLPGFIDSHIHPAAVAMSSWHIPMPMFENVRDLLSYVKDYGDKHPKEEVPFLYFEYYLTNLFLHFQKP